ncbi:MAG: molybdopterin biosynthesis protein MoeB [Hyphomonadaceae bacterium]|nr:molybdopterin biosynthesis protein MoeB [Hyphomonadaceae bacterium]OUX93874.1 MAG: molybdopterin biosynthesis protein MoeB [Hyphomonas sp. TMED17]
MASSDINLERHKRHILLKEIGGPGLQKLQASRVSVIGAGALGGICSLYLAAAGIGEIEVWDDDTVDLSNLQRQIQFQESDIGLLKADCLKQRLLALDASLSVSAVIERLDASSQPAGDILIDATDNFETRFILNDIAHNSGRYLVSGAAARWSGQIAVFGSGVLPQVPCYRCFVPESPPAAEACDGVGIVGALTGQIGSLMALETIKIITGAGDISVGKVQIIDGLSGSSRTVKLSPDRECRHCQG